MILNPLFHIEGLFSQLFPESTQQVSQEIQISEFPSNQVLIKLKKEVRGKIKQGNAKDTGLESLNQIGSKHNIRSLEQVAKPGKNSDVNAEVFGWYKITLDEEEEKVVGRFDPDLGEIKIDTSNKNVPAPRIDILQQLIVKLKLDANIEAVEPNFVVYTQAIPNDPYYSSSGSWGQTYDDLYGMKKINAQIAWDQTTGSTQVVVADIDTGVDRNHEDIKDNMWVNSADPIDGIDNDLNGYKDDYLGWDWVSSDNDPMDDHGHGTHTVGTIAGVGNNGIGVVGVNWISKIMALKFLSSGGSGTLDNGVKALQYAADMGAKVSSNSWGCFCNSKALDDAIKYEHDKGMVVAAAAGNSATDALSFSPASADHAVTVSASDYNDSKASFSNGGEKIDVSAPGVDILSARAATNPMCTAARTVGTNYCRVSGTSMATPHVAGLAALLLSKNPSLNNEEVRQILRGGTDDLGTPGKDKDFGFGRINATKTLNLSNTQPLTPIIISPQSRTLIASKVDVLGSIPGPNFASFKLEFGQGRIPTTYTQLASSNNQVINGVLGSLDTTSLSDGTYTIRLQATDLANKVYQFQVFDLIVDNFDALITSPSAVFGATVDILGTAQTKNGVAFGSYALEYSEGGFSNWSQAGITLVNNGSQPVVNGKLASWDTSLLKNDTNYTLRMTVKSSDGRFVTATRTVSVDKDVLPGWPKDLGFFSDTPAVGDINGDGLKEIIIAPPGQTKVFAFAKDGSNLTGWPLTLSSYIQKSNGVTDINNDGKDEIIVTTGTGIQIIDSSGVNLSGWPKSTPNYKSMVSVGDLDGDGGKEILVLDHNFIFGAANLDIYAFNVDGTTVVGFPKRVFSAAPETLSSSGGDYYMSVVDLEGDGKKEIIFSPEWQNYDSLYVLDYQGNIKGGWPKKLEGKMIDRTLAGDLTGDGISEVIAYYSLPRNSGEDTYIMVYDALGNPLPNYPILASGSVERMGPVLMDATGDGILDIAVAMYGRGGDSLYDCSPIVFTKDGLLPNPACGYYGHQTHPAALDFDGDSQPDIIATAAGTSVIHARRRYFDAAGQLGWQNIWEKRPGPIYIQPIVSDLDKNGKWEVIAMVNTATGTLIFVWEPSQSNSLNGRHWHQHLRDEIRSAAYPPTNAIPPSPLPTPVPTPTPTPTPIPTPTPPDTQPPEVSIISPVDGSQVSRNSEGIIEILASDNVGILHVEFYVNNSLKCTDTEEPYTCSWRIIGKKNATYILKVTAYDSSANSSADTITVKTPPTP